ncbi:cell growth-regulating nucleolar protein [Cricetulus griseus]|uniref:Cell growth-regulating nucleolar protein n=1 Tax=Cricetulus griseus TaxID=10029 RepID=G3GWE6_CRIGR|nr:cell growth-regulating nucleolar protein [Cricetulus griseus]XP_007650045.1 cell growth-regulating nucleolar protein [Cricetulus griseus]XP_027242840.1 cell growth-regulating nucleolar protein [Cricetulus griseus]XP_027242841.1 cell growth-regulating nucleolar protein [Cricetulus griseus]EGV91626.1 Cell growth-regulating nucleolar protein [Cricetulus griseus]ERE88368.1 cell growth-regulating nucleolar protein [Cricetulus griseus]
MVFFTCNACGESVKKIQVEKHVSVCRNCECLSCIDCGKDFWGDDYKSHVKCISENQKYGGKDYEAKTHKGDAKQQAWIQKINELIKKPNVSPKVGELLQQISAFDNVPRKKAKFQNWMRNSLKVHSDAILEQVWNIFSEASSSEQDQQPPSHVAKSSAEIPTKVPSAQTNGTTEEQVEAKKNKRERKEERQKNRKKEKKELKSENLKVQKTKKRKKGQEAGHEAGGEETTKANSPPEKKRARGGQASEEDADRNGGPGEDADEGQTKTGAGKQKRRKYSEVESDNKKKKMKLSGQPEEGETEDHEVPAKGKFNWKGTIKAVLKQAPDNEISIKKLKKKVIAQYHAVTSDHHMSEEELLAIFNKKISKNPTFKVLKDRVKLLK